MDVMQTVRAIAEAARNASRVLASADSAAKDKAILGLADLLSARREQIFEANRQDVDQAKARGLEEAKVKRLEITPRVLDSMIQGCREVAAQDDPVGGIDSTWKRPNGMLVGRMRVPLGVIAMIYESRPNATVDAAILCLKAGNATILRGGSEAFRSNTALAAVIHEALDGAGLPREAVQVLPTTDREAVNALLKMDQFVDVVIPRGGEGLIRAVVDQATMPVLKHYKGVCHVYVDRDADLDQATEIIFNSKVQYPSACNALECLLVHEASANELLPRVAGRLGPAGVLFKACPKSLPLLGEAASPAGDKDFGMEFLSLTMAVKVVGSMDEALRHIAAYGSNHTESIITSDYSRATRFLRQVDASLVCVNASTRFNDGGQLGLGAEIGISTSKLHAYGPMGVRELTSTKFIVLGEGHVRQ